MIVVGLELSVFFRWLNVYLVFNFVLAHSAFIGTCN